MKMRKHGLKMRWEKCKPPRLSVICPMLIMPSVRAPTADLPNTAAFLGGLVAQETIKMITRQYVPVKGYCLIDLVGSTTGVIDG